jgi:secreted trypsin-like serine protease
MSKRSWMTVSALGALVALTGCGAQDPSASSAGDPLASADQAIMGGVSDSGDTNVVDIVWMMSGGSFAECSGSLLAPNMVLTAHHCVATLQNAPNDQVDCQTTDFAAPDVVSNFLVSTQELLSMNEADYHKVRQVVVPPNSTNTKLCGVDQAILILEDNIAPSEAVPLIPRVDSQIAAGEPYTAIGFGITMDGATDSGTRRKLTGLKVDCVGTPCAQIAGDQIDTTHEYIGDHGTCQGDSGGPALDQYNRVAGVTSRGGAECTSPIYGDVYAWASWIEATAETAAGLGGYPVPTWATGYPTDPAYSAPIGGACSGDGGTCPSYGVCVSGSSGDYCSRLCEAAAPCPSGYTCEANDGQQVCIQDPMVTSTGNGTGGGAGLPPGFTPAQKSGCSVPRAADPTKPVPWFLGLGALVFAQRLRSKRSNRSA